MRNSPVQMGEAGMKRRRGEARADDYGVRLTAGTALRPRFEEIDCLLIQFCNIALIHVKVYISMETLLSDRLAQFWCLVWQIWPSSGWGSST